MPVNPVTRMIHTEDSLVYSSTIWFSYQVEVKAGHPFVQRELLHITAECDLVRSVEWVDQQARVRLAQIPSIFFVGPSTPACKAEQEIDINVGDLRCWSESIWLSHSTMLEMRVVSAPL